MYTFTGCSGFHYKHWKSAFYPEELSEKEWLPYYAEHFKTVEINHSFYSLPKEKELLHWYEQTPGHFRFTMKGSRYITHMKKLVDDKDLRAGLKKFYGAIEPLQGKLGCVLWQLPGNLHRNDEKLNTFCSLLSSNIKNVIEFRHQSWFTEEVLEILKERQVSYCIISAPDDLPEYIKASTDTAYVRFHGKTDWYQYEYSNNELSTWAERIKELSVKRTYLYFNNDAEARAPANAQQMQKLLDENH